MKNASTFFIQGTRRPGRSRRSGHGSRCPCFTDAGQPRPRRGCQNPMLANTAQPVRRTGGAKRPRKHRVCVPTTALQASRDYIIRLCKHGVWIAPPAACLGYALEPYALRGAAREARRGPQEPPAIRPRQIPAPETRGQQRANAEAWRAILCHAASSRRKRRGRAASRQQEQPPHGGPGVRICTHIRTGRTLAAGCSYKSQK